MTNADPYGKLRQARTQLEAIKVAHDEYGSSEPFEYYIERKPAQLTMVEVVSFETGTGVPVPSSKPKNIDGYWNCVCARIRRPPPPQLAFDIGDCANNIRSALDHLVSSLSNLPSTDERERRSLEFPILRPGSPLPNPNKINKSLNGVRQNHRQMILSWQPASISSELWVLAELNNADKHREIVTVGTVSEIMEYTLFLPHPSGEVPGGRWGKRLKQSDLGKVGKLTARPVAQNGDVVAVFGSFDDGELESVGRSRVRLNFSGPTDALRGQEVLPTLDRLFGRVHEIVDTLAFWMKPSPSRSGPVL